MATTEIRGKQIHMPFSEALKIAVRNIRIRFWRALITTAGIMLAIAFLASILTSSSINIGLAKQAVDSGLQTMKEELPAQRIWVVIMSLLVCVVGITNSMLMAVTERYKEIGTMKCLGALDRFIIEMFILESGMQGLLGSVVGTVVGVLMSIIMAVSKEGPRIFKTMTFFQQFSLNDIGIIILTCVGAGVVLAMAGAMYPAYTASKMVPADAMRVEM